MNLLLVHGNGGANARFELFRAEAQKANAPFRIHLPLLPGFEGRPLAQAGKPWSWFLDALAETVAQEWDSEPWVFYGHGIGGSMLLEWARRGWQDSHGRVFKPQKVILHGVIGASLEQRFFPKLMQPTIVRRLIKMMIASPVFRPFWEKHLFLRPKEIPNYLRRQFFEDYRRCDAFPLFFDLITPDWYRSVKQALKEEPFHFLWGSKERVVASKYLQLWQQDFPKGEFTIIEGWDHFPMLEQPTSFYEQLLKMTT